MATALPKGAERATRSALGASLLTYGIFYGLATIVADDAIALAQHRVARVEGLGLRDAS